MKKMKARDGKIKEKDEVEIIIMKKNDIIKMG